MNRRNLLGGVLLLGLLGAGVLLLSQRSALQPETVERLDALQAMNPAGGAVVANSVEGIQEEMAAVAPVVMNVADLDTSITDEETMYDRWINGEIDLIQEGLVSNAALLAMQEDSMNLAPNVDMQIAGTGPTTAAPSAGSVSFDSISFADLPGSVPPDPEMAAGTTHLIAVVNVGIEIYDKTGTSVFGPASGASFFNGLSGCTSGLYDPNVSFDEEEQRWIVAFDVGAFNANGGFCLAASQTADPTGAWNTYFFPLNSASAWMDFPHTGVGDEYIFMGGNMFSMAGSFVESRAYAWDKSDLYAGNAVSTITRSLPSTVLTPQPLKIHGDAMSWPNFGNVHYFMGDPYDGTMTLFSWDPSINDFNVINNFDVGSSGIGQPVTASQSGGGGTLNSGDWRGLDFEYRNGYGWGVSSVACNPGSGTVTCLRWMQVDLQAGTLGPAGFGIYGSNGVHRIKPDLAVNACNDMVVGYTRTDSSSFPSVYVNGRTEDTPSGQLDANELLVKAGEITYSAFDPAPRRWGDYTGMTMDPDGVTFWYLGQYSKNTGLSTRWGNWIGSFTYPDCVPFEATDFMYMPFAVFD